MDNFTVFLSCVPSAKYAGSSPEQVVQIEKANPCFRERHVKSSEPGELLSQNTFYVGFLKGVSRVFLPVVVETYGSCAFGLLHASKKSEAAVSVLHNHALPFYQDLELDVDAVIMGKAKSLVERKLIPFHFTWS